MKDRALAGSRRSDDRKLLALTDAKRHTVERRDAETRRIGEMHVLERGLAAWRQRQDERLRRTEDRGLDRQDLEQTFRSTRGRGDLAADLRQRAQGAGGEYRIEDELAEPAGRHAVAQYVLGADPEHDDDARPGEEDGKRRKQGARADRMARGLEGALHRAAKARDAEPLIGEGLQDANGADQFSRIGRGVGERVLREAR